MECCGINNSRKTELILGPMQIRGIKNILKRVLLLLNDLKFYFIHLLSVSKDVAVQSFSKSVCYW